MAVRRLISSTSGFRKRVRHGLGRLQPVRSAYYLAAALRDYVRWGNAQRCDGWMEWSFSQKADPWNYSDPIEQDRFRSAIALLDLVCKGGAFRRAFEVGCAEGAFTELLAPRCAVLTAADVSSTALGRARLREMNGHVEFLCWNLRTDPLPDNLDLIVIMDVLEMFYRPRQVRMICNKLVQALCPGGYLLVGNSRQNQWFETSWWGRAMLRGGVHISRFFGEHAELETVGDDLRSWYVNTLFQKRANVFGAKGLV